ncbi:MAG: UDP-2,3-diacylglucosamine diphosphatase LpxI, partial [Alphaproteobacteria bacterium]|nr:UDP-2,3-diacylglucosamine diphosphatase LpxI [Alphaproteobacteria bacterium]
LALRGHADPDLLPKGIPVRWVRLGAVGAAFRACRAAGVQEVVLIGAVKRPGLWEIRPDWTGMKMLARVGLNKHGDDGLLRRIVREIERAGFSVVGADAVLPSLKAVKGIYGKAAPGKADTDDIRKGFRVAKILGAADVGQGAVVQRGLVLAVEAIEGTAEMIRRAGALKRPGGGGVLVKCAKPQQEKRVDLPTIGPGTIQSLADAGLKGVAVEAGGALIADAEKTIALADKLGVFVVGAEEEACRH